MKTKTSIQFLLLAIIMAGVLAACAPAAPTTAPTAVPPTAAPAAAAPTTAAAAPTTAPAAPAVKPKLTVWLGTSFTPDADTLNKVNIEAWAKAKGVDLILVQEQCTVIQTQLNAALESKVLPDVVSWCLPDMAPKMARLGLAMDVSDLVKKFNTQGGGYYDFSVKAVTLPDGTAFAVPTNAATEVFYVRKDLLEAKNLKAPETWTDVATVAKALNEKGKQAGFGMQLGTGGYDSERHILSLLASYGASPYGVDGKTPNLKNDGARQAIALLKDLWDVGAIPPAAVTWDDAGNNQAYLTKAVAMIYNTGSVVAAMRKDDTDLLNKTLLVPIPAGPKGRVIIGDLFGLTIAKNTKYPDLARDLVTYILDVERQKKFVETAGSNYMPLYKDLSKEKMWEDPLNKVLINQLGSNVAYGYPGPTSEWALEAWRVHTMTEMMQRVLIDKWDADRAIIDAEAKLVKIYGQFNK